MVLVASKGHQREQQQFWGPHILTRTLAGVFERTVGRCSDEKRHV